MGLTDLFKKKNNDGADGEQPNIELAPSALAATAAPANDPFTKFRRVKPRFSFSLIFPPSFRFPFKPA